MQLNCNLAFLLFVYWSGLFPSCAALIAHAIPHCAVKRIDASARMLRAFFARSSVHVLLTHLLLWNASVAWIQNLGGARFSQPPGRGPIGRRGFGCWFGSGFFVGDALDWRARIGFPRVASNIATLAYLRVSR